MKYKASIMDQATVKRALVRMSHEILEKNKGADDICLVGILRRGKPLASIIKENIKAIEGVEVCCGDIDISFYRDDLDHLNPPVVNKARLDFPVEDKTVIIVDDVLYTGRTVRAAIEAIFSLGRPKAIRLAILVDRGHRELPIRADFAGKSIPTSRNEFVKVMIPPYDEEMGVFLYEKE
ncbi:MAG: bifunctional pyr operon transcriptional regulator/uracil phosphoribosyltransferase PyrR [Ruminococcaceae bacterium]|nr:bifunctional pyr operon transcriptional regulator/uracil phosphoribosyltransferase PyrR [Oscillospiraceae bacterium]